MIPLDLVVDYSIKREDFPYSNSLINGQVDKAWKSINKNFFPKSNLERNTKVHELALIRLLYLASVKSNPNKFVFIQRHFNVLQISDSKANQALWLLRICCVVNTILFLGIPFLVLIPTSIPAPIEWSAGTAAGVAATGAIANSLSFWATGWAPDDSSNAKNAKQDALFETQNIFEDLAFRLIRLYFSPGKSEAIKIANSIDIEDLSRRFDQLIHSPSRTDDIIERLREAVLFITSEEKTFPDNSNFHTFIENYLEK